MRNKAFLVSLLLLSLFTLTGCSAFGEQTVGISIIYGATAILSFALLVWYSLAIRKKNAWLLLLFSSVFVVNLGYFTLSVSRNLEEALLSNRISYLGSVFLPMAMLMIIRGVTRMKQTKALPIVLLVIGVVIFFIAASPGYLDIYYKEVVFDTSEGVGVLKKTYGPLHVVYLIYLLGYFLAMLLTVIRSVSKKKIDSIAHAAVLLIAVFVNLAVWFVEQFADINFEFLSISYIISELFLVGIHFLTIENERLKEAAIAHEASVSPEKLSTDPADRSDLEQFDESAIEQFTFGIGTLTPTERAIFDFYIDGKSTKEIMVELNIKENTLKFHNKNIYGKLGVSSRKQLLCIHKKIKQKTDS